MREFELAALDSVRSFLKRASSRHAPPPGTLCANCDTELAGLYCHACGQAADNHHRNLWHLIWEGIEGLFHMDGRLWRTLPPLFFRPGLLARDYMAGRLARHVPPFRTFLVSLLLFIFSAEHLIHQMQHDAAHHPEPGAHAAKDTHMPGAEATPEAKAAQYKADEALAKTGLKTESEKPRTVTSNGIFYMDDEERKAMADEIRAEKVKNRSTSGVEIDTDGFKAKLAKAVENPGLFILNVFTWGHRMAVLLLPIMSLILGGLYFYRRQFFIFDHFLVSCNLLSFIFLTNAFGFILPEIVRGPWFLALMVWTPVNIFMTLRGAYGSGIFGGIIKTLILWFSTMISFAALVVWLSWLALQSM